MSGKNIYSSDNDYGDGFYDEPFRKEYKPQKVIKPAKSKNNTKAKNNRKPVAKPPKKQKKKKGCFGKFVCVVLVIIAVILILAGIFVIVVMSRVNYTGEYTDHSISLDEGIVLREESDIENILVFGEDNHKEGEHGRADSMILITIDKKHSLLKQTSFMRDLYVMIPGYGYNKLNAAYVLGGAKLSAETIEYNFGIKIDNYIIIDFNSFMDIIDSLGGVDIELTYDEIKYINWQSYRNKQTETEVEIDPDSYTYSENNNGEEVASVHLNGRQALWYARDRDSYGSDFDRTKRQRIVVNCVTDKFRKSDPFHIISMLYSASGYLSTNIDQISLCGIGIDFFFASGNKKVEHRLPTSDNYYDVWNESGQALQIDDLELEKERLYSFIFGAIKEED